jgi:hypothetical protein|tara:strand:- start:146 stop:352 length:207 start_codon:yes stop_codon:yes gene_type:complete
VSRGAAMSYIIVQVPEEPDLEETTPLVAEDGDSLETFETMLEAQIFMQEILEPFFGNHMSGLEILRIH